MTGAHVFQRYSQPENVITNNTLQLLRVINLQRPDLLEELLSELLEGRALGIGRRFLNQVKGSGSVLDGVIAQDSFCVAIETKRGDSAWEDQLERHLSYMRSSTASLRVLLVLGTEAPTISAGLKSSAENAHPTIDILPTSFRHLIGLVRDIIPEHERLLQEIVEDYSAFCQDIGLLTNGRGLMLAASCRTSLEDNIAFRLYYNTARPQRTQYFGTYSDKRVNHLAEVALIVRVQFSGAELVEDECIPTLHNPEARALTADEKHRILQARISALSKWGWDFTGPHYFLLLGELIPTSFQKVSAGGLRGRRYFDLYTTLGLEDGSDLPAIGDLADSLRNVNWA